MDTTAASFINPDASGLEVVGLKPTGENLARRARQRRRILAIIAINYVVDAAVLWLYAYSGSIPVLVGPAYAVCGLGFVGGCITLSEAGVNERFRDHYMVVEQSIVGIVIMLAFTFVAPEAGVIFLCNLLLVVSLGSLRSRPQQTIIIWTVATLGLAGLFLLTDKPISMPLGTYLDRFTTMLVFVLTVGRCMFVGVFSSALRQSLYEKGLKLKEAYKRIEELAELDELTGSFNRRSIMRMLDEEIARARRNQAPCSVALIDLDWFKRINDTYGHPIGDEVLRTFAITIFANIRSVDRFGRYGGEEFLLVLPDMPEANAAQALDRLRTIVATLDWSAFSPGMTVTISAGIAMLRPDDSPDTFLGRADSALYAAKARGRNCIAVG